MVGARACRQGAGHTGALTTAISAHGTLEAREEASCGVVATIGAEIKAGVQAKAGDEATTGEEEKAGVEARAGMVVVLAGHTVVVVVEAQVEVSLRMLRVMTITRLSPSTMWSVQTTTVCHLLSSFKN